MFKFSRLLAQFTIATAFAVLCDPLAASAQSSPTKCEDFPFGISVRDRVIINSDNGRAVTINSLTIQTWDLQTGQLLDSQALPFGSGSEAYLMGFVNKDEVIVFDYGDMVTTTTLRQLHRTRTRATSSTPRPTRANLSGSTNAAPTNARIRSVDLRPFHRASRSSLYSDIH